MAQYCDSKVLESNWFNWLLAQAVPDLEEYRVAGVLYTKVLGTIESRPGGPKYPDPMSPRRYHALARKRRIFVESYRGKPHTPVYYNGGKPVRTTLPTTNLVADESSVAALTDLGYIREVPAAVSWEKVLLDVRKICAGIVQKFKIHGEENREDLASEAFTQVSNKIKTLKLVYLPGKAPVFNLLTTTIYRIIYSILNKDSKSRNRASALRQGLVGLTLANTRKPLAVAQRQADLIKRLPQRT